MDVIRLLVERWRERADDLSPFTPPGVPAAFQECARDLEDMLRTAASEVLTLDEAAAESGYSKRRLRELVSEGTIPNAGRKNAPRIRRADLPSKPGRSSDLGAFDPAAEARRGLRAS